MSTLCVITRTARRGRRKFCTSSYLKIHIEFCRYVLTQTNHILSIQNESLTWLTPCFSICIYFFFQAAILYMWLFSSIRTYLQLKNQTVPLCNEIFFEVGVLYDPKQIPAQMHCDTLTRRYKSALRVLICSLTYAQFIRQPFLEEVITLRIN